ncbi:putative secreted protein [Clostridium bornimense]|uniref:histidine kinase n=1 Tax=Clostridium bornimense TaxID=1216932 RepID=W6RST2_9CLOT|nr:hypothetical protein [Clostridium bornimense]CDM67666.1 putative secreted protein [Clostridium bornimense]
MKSFIRVLMALWSIILVFTIGLSINYIDTLNVNGVGVNGDITVLTSYNDGASVADNAITSYIEEKNSFENIDKEVYNLIDTNTIDFYISFIDGEGKRNEISSIKNTGNSSYEKLLKSLINDSTISYLNGTIIREKEEPENWNEIRDEYGYYGMDYDQYYYENLNEMYTEETKEPLKIVKVLRGEEQSIDQNKNSMTHHIEEGVKGKGVVYTWTKPEVVKEHMYKVSSSYNEFSKVITVILVSSFILLFTGAMIIRYLIRAKKIEFKEITNIKLILEIKIAIVVSLIAMLNNYIQNNRGLAYSILSSICNKKGLNIDINSYSYVSGIVKILAQGSLIAVIIVFVWWGANMILSKEFRKKEIEKSLYLNLKEEAKLKGYYLLVAAGIVCFWIIFNSVTNYGNDVLAAVTYVVICFAVIIPIISKLIDGLIYINQCTSRDNKRIDEETDEIGLVPIDIIIKNINKIKESIKEKVTSTSSNKNFKEQVVENMAEQLIDPVEKMVVYAENISENKDRMENLNKLWIESNDLKESVDRLFEISKANTNTLKLNLADVNVSNLLDQAIGEYEDEIDKNQLKLIRNNKETFYSRLDGEKFFKALDNIMNVIVKESFKNTRIYIDTILGENSGILEIKYISREEVILEDKINILEAISDDGSNQLLLSKALIDAQGGNVDILVDGDLVKITIMLKVLSKGGE